MDDLAERDPGSQPARAPVLRLESAGVSVVRQRRRLWAARLLVAGGWLTAHVLLTTWMSTSAGCWPTVLGFTALALLFGSFRGDPTVGVTRRGKRGVITVEDSALRVESGGHTQTVALEDLVAGWTDGAAGAERVVLETRAGLLVSIEVGSPAAAHALLQALGVAPEQRAVAMLVGVSPEPAVRFLYALIGLLSGTVAVPATLATVVGAIWAMSVPNAGSGVWVLLVGVVAAIFGVGAWLCLGQLVATTVRIGTDGVSVERLGRHRFLARADLKGLSVNDGALFFERRSGGHFAVVTSGPDEAVTLRRRVEEALAAHRNRAPGEALLALDRSGRPVEAWRLDVQALLGSGAGYRRAGLEVDDLLGVVEDGAAKPERRVAAAVALAVNGDVEERARVRERVRVAAEACVGTKLRIALAQAADGEIDEDALAAAEEETTRLVGR